MSFNNEYASPDLLTDRRFGAPTEFPHVYVGRPPGARVPGAVSETEFTDALVLTAANPTLIAVDTQRRRDVRSLRRYVRRPETVPPQFNPTFNFPNIKPRRDVRGLLRRGKRWERTPPQLNPPITFTVPQPRKVRGLFSRKSHPIETPLTQAAPAVNPDFSWGRTQPRTMRGLLRRKAKPVEIVPAQVVYIQSDVPWSRTQVRALRGLLSRRMGHPVMFIFPGAISHHATGLYLERDAIRIIPLVTDDGITWRPRGT